MMQTAAVALALFLMLGVRGLAATGTWNSTSSTDFNNTGNWTWTNGTPNLGGPGLNDTLVFPAKGSLVQPVLTADAYAYRLDTSADVKWNLGVYPSTQVLHLGAGGLSAFDNSNNNCRISLDADQTWNIIATGGGIVFTNALSGTGRMTLTGRGIIVLGGTNTAFSGGITLNAAELRLVNPDALGMGALRFTGGSTLYNKVSGQTNNLPVEVATSTDLLFRGLPYTFAGPWVLNSMLKHNLMLDSGSAWSISGPMTGPGGIWSVFLANAIHTLSLSGTNKTFTGPILAASLYTGVLDISATTTPKSVTVFQSSGTGGATAGAPLQMGAAGTLGSGRVEILSGGMIAKSAGNLAGNASVLIKATPLQMGYLAVQYDGALPVFHTNATGTVALDATYTASITNSLGSLFLGAVNANTFSGSVLAAGNNNTWWLGGGGSTLALDAAGTTGVLTGSGKSLVVGIPAARTVNGGFTLTQCPGVNNGNGTVMLKDDNDFDGSITVNGSSTLTAAKPATAVTLSPLGANWDSTPGHQGVTLIGGELRLDNTIAGTNNLAVGKGALAVSGRSMVGVYASATRAATLTFDSLAFDPVTGGALFINDGGGTSLGRYGKVMITGQAATNLVSPRILGATAADFLQYDAANGVTGATYVTQAATFTPAGEIARVTNALTINPGTLQALHLTSANPAFITTLGGTVNLVSGGLSLDQASGSNSLSGGTLHFGAAGDSTVEGFLGIKGSQASNGQTPSKPVFLTTSLDGGAGATFFALSVTNNIRGYTSEFLLDNLPTGQPISGTLKFLDATSVGFARTGTWNLGPGGAGALFPNVTSLVFNGARFICGWNGSPAPSATVTIGQDIALGSNGVAFVTLDSAATMSVTLNGNLTGTGPFLFENGGSSSILNVNGTNTNSGGVTLGGGVITVNTNSSLGMGEVIVKQGSGNRLTTLNLLGDANLSPLRRLYVEGATSGTQPVNVNFKSGAPEVGSLAGVGGVVALGGTTNDTVLSVGSDNTDTIFGGVIANAAGRKGSLIKKGAGALTLLGANTYTGATTVTAGTLLVDGVVSTSAVTVAAGATLGGFGTILGVVTNSGVLAPGDPLGTLTLATNLTFQNNAVLACTLGPATNSLVQVNGTLVLGAATTLRLTDAGRSKKVDPDADYVLIRYAGADPVLGSWSVDYGTTGWRGARVRLDTANKQVTFRFSGLRYTVIFFQ